MDGETIVRQEHIQELLLLAVARRDAGRHDAAADLCRIALALQPDHFDAQHLYALSAAAAGQRVADQRFLRAARLNPLVPELWRNFARFRIQSGQPAETRPLTRHAVSLSPDLAEAYIMAGVALRDSGPQGPAIVNFRRALRLEPGHGTVRAELGGSLFAVQLYDDAATAFRGLLTQNPGLRLAVLHYGHALMAAKRPEAAIPWFVRACALEPEAHRTHTALGMALVEAGREEEAPPHFDAALRLSPGSGENFTLRSCILLRRFLSRPPLCAPDPPPPPAAMRVAMSTLGRNGRFGNSVLQYGFLRMYAAEFNLTHETPEWIGRYLYDLDDDPWINTPLSQLHEKEAYFEDVLARRVNKLYVNFDIQGHFTYPTGSYRKYKSFYQNLFRPGARLAPVVAPAMERLRRQGDMVVAMHLRRGDFGDGPFWIAPEEWYHAWLERYWAGLPRPVLYIASDEPALIDRFRAYHPLTQHDVGPVIPGAEFYTDHYVLSQCDVALISNSTFSFTACMINPVGRYFFRPDRERRELVQFDPWDADPPQAFIRRAAPAGS